MSAPPPRPADAAPGGVPSFPWLRKVDAAWYRGELWLCGFMFLAMALIVFVAVVRDVFGTRHSLVDALVLFLLIWGGAATRVVKGGEKKRSVLTNAIIALVGTSVIAGLVEAYVTLLPGGFNWAPKMALCLMLWVAFLGASMATYEKAHIALEVGEKIWPKALARYVRVLAHFVTTGFCLALFVLSIYSLVGHYEAWTVSDHYGDVVPTLEWLPQWTVFIVFPYVFLAMGVRFLAQMVTTANGTAAPPMASEEVPSEGQAT